MPIEINYSEGNREWLDILEACSSKREDADIIKLKPEDVILCQRSAAKNGMFFDYYLKLKFGRLRGEKQFPMDDSAEDLAS